MRLIDEFITPGAKLPQYLFMQHCEYVWRMQVRANAVYQIFVKKHLSRYYDRVDDFFFWNRVFAKEVVEMAESEDEGISNEIDSFVVSLRLLQDVANNVPDIVPAYLRLEEEKEDKSKKPPANPINFK